MKLSKIFGNGMVFQAEKPIRIFGEGKGMVSASFLGETKEHISNGENWVLEFSPKPYGGPYEMEITLDDKKFVLSDILIGEVILFSGQSNIQFHLSETNVPECEYITDCKSRLYVCTRPEPGDNINSDDGWVYSDSRNAGDWPALAYLVARDARRSGIPYVGVIVCCQGATVIQSWLPPALLNAPEFRIPPDELFVDHTEYASWNSPGFMYDFSLKSILPFSFGNVVWYQGESNISPAESKIYGKMLSIFIDFVRDRDKDPGLPFQIVGIADTRTWEGWLGVQKAQREACDIIKRAYYVRSGDISENDMIHPITKAPLASRIFLSMKQNGLI